MLPDELKGLKKAKDAERLRKKLASLEGCYADSEPPVKPQDWQDYAMANLTLERYLQN